MASTNAIFPRPYFIIDTSSPVRLISFPKKVSQSHLRAPATGTRANAFSPTTPSARISTVSPEAKAISIDAVVPTFVGSSNMAHGSRLNVR